jgi:tRNA-dihydrouridine synthase 3
MLMRPRRFLLEWMSFAHRYIPLELLEVVPQRLHWRAPAYVGRSLLETLLASESAADWVRLSEMLLGSAPSNFSFSPKHKANAYTAAASEAAMALEGQENG